MRGSLTARAPTSSALVLALSATVAGFGLVVPARPLGDQRRSSCRLRCPSQNQDAESLVFLATFAVLLPLAARPRPARARPGQPRATAREVAAELWLCSRHRALRAARRRSRSRNGRFPLRGPGMLLCRLCGPVARRWPRLRCVGLSRGEIAPRAALAGSAPASGRRLPRPSPLSSSASPTSVRSRSHRSRRASRSPRQPGTSSPSGRHRSGMPPRALRVGRTYPRLALIALAVPNLVVFRPEDPSAAFRDDDHPVSPGLLSGAGQRAPRWRNHARRRRLPVRRRLDPLPGRGVQADPDRQRHAGADRGRARRRDVLPRIRDPAPRGRGAGCSPGPRSRSPSSSWSSTSSTRSAPCSSTVRSASGCRW